MKRFIISLLLLAAFTVPAFAQDTQGGDPVITRDVPPNPAIITFERLPVDGLQRPLFITPADDGSGRLFLVQQGGIVYALQPETYERNVFLDVSNLVTWDANTRGYTERGLLGLAFHPNYAENGLFYINYTNRQGATHIAAYSVSDDPNVADISSGEIIFTQPQPFANHNGGHMAFGPDGYLYASLGDGGSANDPLAAGQNPQTLLGTIIRIDVNAPDDTGYAIPPDNPFVGSDSGADEVWAYGLRNVWRFSFDMATGDMYLGDVGQNQYEEINFEAAVSSGGRNYGWNAFEASNVFNPRVNASNAVPPVAEYTHSAGCSVTGGYVYRGMIEDLQGVYLYGDYCSGRMWYLYRDAQMNWQSDVFMDTDFQIASFGQDESGEMYVVDYQGAVYRIALNAG
jgi:glucose/arabinose dehydrogenase